MIALGDIAVIGGGCYGTFYLGQLERARAKGAVTYRRLLIVDRDPACQAAAIAPAEGRELVVMEWNAFLDAWLDRRARDADGLVDHIVPSPLMPHLLAQWVERQGRTRWPAREIGLVPADGTMGTPFDRLHVDGVRYVSYADWLCPTHCVEPAICPATRAPRTWEMGDAVRDWTGSRGAAGPVLFTCEHVTYGVGMYPVRTAFEGMDELTSLAECDAGGELVIGSLSSCHGAVGVLRVASR